MWMMLLHLHANQNADDDDDDDDHTIFPECPLLLHHLNNASKSLTTRNLIQKMSCPSP